MASWADIFALVATLSVAGIVIYVITVVQNQIATGVSGAQEQLKSKGLDISTSGVTVKTGAKFDREDYVDATQRGFVKALENASYGKPVATSPDSPNANGNSESKHGHSMSWHRKKEEGQRPLITNHRRGSDASSEKDKKGFWKRRKD